MIEAFIIAALLVFIGYREWMAQKERKDLLDRIMAKDPAEYRQFTTGDEPNQLDGESEDENIISLSVDNPDDIPEEIRKEIENA